MISVQSGREPLLGLVKIDLRVWVSSMRRQVMPRRLAVVAGARQVFRPVCGPAERGRSVHSCTGSPSPEGRPRPPRSLGSVAGPRTPPGRSDGSARLCRSVAAGGAECIGAGSRRPRPRARRRRRTLARGHTAAAGWGTERPAGARPGRRGSSDDATADRAAGYGSACSRRSVLKRPAARDLHVLHVDLNRLSRFRLLEEFHLAGFPLARAPQAGQAHVSKHPLNRAHGQPDPVYALEPEPGARCPVAELLAGVADELDGRGRHPPRPVPRIGRHQLLDPPAPPALPPAPNGPSTESIVPARRGGPVFPRILQHHQAVAHPRPILRPNLHVAELDHGAAPV